MKRNFISGFLIGALIFGSGAAYAATVLATPATPKVYIDGKQANISAYNIDGNNYFKLRDLGQAMDFSVIYDDKAKSILIDSKTPYVAETAITNGIGAITVPQGDDRFIPKAGDKILCDDGTIYEIKDMSRHGQSMFADGPLPPLPKATCDWSQFPELALPAVEARHFKGDDGKSDTTKVFTSLPHGTFSIEAWDVYSNGVFQYTEYMQQVL